MSVVTIVECTITIECSIYPTPCREVMSTRRSTGLSARGTRAAAETDRDRRWRFVRPRLCPEMPSSVSRHASPVTQPLPRTLLSARAMSTCLRPGRRRRRDVSDDIGHRWRRDNAARLPRRRGGAEAGRGGRGGGSRWHGEVSLVTPAAGCGCARQVSDR